MNSNPFLQPNRTVSLSGSIRYPAGREMALSPCQILSCSASVGVRDGMLPGAVVARQCTVLLHNENGLFTAGLDPVGAYVQLNAHADHTAFPLAAFYVTAVSRPDGSDFITLTGSDALGLYFDAPFQDQLSYPVSLQTLAEYILQKAGFSESLSFPCMAHQVPVKPDWGEISLRGALSFVAQACGCFVTVQADGRIGLCPAFDAAETPYEIFPENTFSCSGGDAAFGPLKGVSIALYGAEKDETPLTVSVDDTPLDNGNRLHIARNPLFMKETAFSRMLAVDMLAVLGGLRLSRLQLSWQGDPAVRLGQRIRVHRTDGSFDDTCITSLSFAADHGFSMQTDCTFHQKKDFAGKVFTASGGINGALLEGEVNGALLKAESVTARKIAASAITAEKLNAGCVTAEKIAANSIAGNHLQANSISSDQLQSASITTEKLAAGAVTAEKIAGKSITAEQLQAGLITAQSGLIGDSAIGTAQIADGSITEAKIVSLNADVIKSGTLQTDRLLLTGEGGVVYEINAASSGLSQSELSKAEYENKIAGSVLVAESVTAAQIAANAVTANKILSGAVTTDKLKANAVTTDKIAAQSVTANKLASDVGSSLDLSSNQSVKLMVSDIQVGGENLLPDTRLMENWSNSRPEGKPVTFSRDHEGFGVAAWPVSEALSWSSIAPDAQNRPFYSAVRNKRVTLSFDFRSDAWQEGEKLTVYLSLSNNGSRTLYRTGTVDVPVSREWVKVEKTYDVTDAFFTSGSGEILDDTRFYPAFYVRVLSGCEIRKMKLEIGNKATDWSPAPEDGAYTTSAVLDRNGIHLNTGGTFTVDSQNFDIDAEGQMTAKAGSIGGWEIAPGSLSSGSGAKHVRLSTEDATYAIWAGAENAGNAPFRVTRDGQVYLTMLYATDQNGQNPQTVNLSANWWRTNRAVQSMDVNGNTLTITLYDGTTVNFKKADGYGYITGLANGSTITIGGYKLNESGQGEIVDSGAITLTLDTENKKVNFSGGAGFKNFTAANGMDVTALYNTGWNEALDHCSYQSDVYRISENQPASPLYMKVGDNYTSVGTGWVRTARATGVYTLPARKT